MARAGRGRYASHRSVKIKCKSRPGRLLLESLRFVSTRLIGRAGLSRSGPRGKAWPNSELTDSIHSPAGIAQTAGRAPAARALPDVSFSSSAPLLLAAVAGAAGAAGADRGVPSSREESGRRLRAAVPRTVPTAAAGMMRLGRGASLPRRACGRSSPSAPTRPPRVVVIFCESTRQAGKGGLGAL